MDRNRWSEFDVVRHLQRSVRTFSKGLQTGIGDDCAVISCGPDQDLLVTTDLLVEGVHFERRWFSLFQIGSKALRVALSDIAAMGGVPEYVFVGMALPPSVSADEGAKILKGIRETAELYKVTLAGGDLSRSGEGIVLDIILLGNAKRGKSILRSGARPGDQLFVSGALGDAALGLQLMKMEQGEDDRTDLPDRQRSPEPRMELGRILGEEGWATAMMDLSDGISSDLLRLCEASDVGAVLRLYDLPASVPLRSICATLALDSVPYLLHGGEDYELLFTVSADVRSTLEQADLPVPVTPVGEILPAKAGVWLEDPEGSRRPLLPQGYDHFR
ncbi:MAG: thiamine-phosphate kinase [Deltaproteobacteria bacterium]|nr:thiamine-phosphate kinase [Deltaproteobacteria bacterium]